MHKYSMHQILLQLPGSILYNSLARSAHIVQHGYPYFSWLQSLTCVCGPQGRAEGSHATGQLSRHHHLPSPAPAGAPSWPWAPGPGGRQWPAAHQAGVTRPGCVGLKDLRAQDQGVRAAGAVLGAR